MTQYAYSPDTGELIRTESPADWMGSTDVTPPAFDPATAGCFWRGGAWEVVVPTPVTPGEIFAAKVAEYEFSVRAYLDEGARAAQYDNILSARSYAGYPNKYQAESITFIVWSAAVWDAATTTLNAVLAGASIPPLDEFMASLPDRMPPPA